MPKLRRIVDIPVASKADATRGVFPLDRPAPLLGGPVGVKV
jgi:hypothetical protein